MALVSLAAPGCGVQGLAFVQDDRVDITEPSGEAETELPLRVAWDTHGYNGSYAVFFDRAPMRPGASLRSLVAATDPCLIDADCPDDAWLAEHGVYVVDGTELVVDVLPDLRTSNRSKDRHELTLVLLDDLGNRIGESAFVDEFIIARHN